MEESQIPCKVVAVTAYANEANISKCHMVGMSEVLHKPVNVEALKKAIATYYLNQ